MVTVAETYYEIGEKDTEENIIFYEEDTASETEDLNEPSPSSSPSKHVDQAPSSPSVLKRKPSVRKTGSVLGFLFGGSVKKSSSSSSIQTGAESKRADLDIKLQSSQGLPGII